MHHLPYRSDVRFLDGIGTINIRGHQCRISSVVQDRNECAVDLNHDLNLIKRWAHDWRMSLNPDPSKQAVEVTFSKKKISVDHLSIFFNDVTVMKVDENKHLGVVLDSRLTFSSHIQSAINKTRLWIGMLQFLSNYLPRPTLNELYKLYVRPHLDYGHVIYDIPQKVCDWNTSCCYANIRRSEA